MQRNLLETKSEKIDNEIVITEKVEKKLNIKDCLVLKQDYIEQLNSINKRMAQLNAQASNIQAEIEKIDGFISQLNSKE